MHGSDDRNGGPAPAVSIVLAVFDPPHDALSEQLEAIAHQTSADWECLVVDDASTDAAIGSILETWVADDPGRRRLIRRPVNGGIAAATNDGIDAASGSVVTICDHDDVIDTDAVAALIEHFADHPDHDVVYTDEQLIDADGSVIAPYLKPDYSPRRHLGHHYLAHLVAGRREVIGDLRVRAEFEPAQDYDFWIRVIERSTDAGHRVGHIDRILYSWRAITGSSALAAGEKPEMCDAVRRCSQAALDRRGIERTATTIVHAGLPTTSVRIEPSDDDDATRSISFVEITADADPLALNRAVSEADGDVVCFVPDAAAIDDDWARPLAYEASRRGVGVVGPKVVTPTGLLVSIGRMLAPAFTEQFAGEPADASGPWGAFFVVREVSAVAPAGLTIDRATFDEVGGFGPDMSLDVAAADLSLRLAARGAATLVHPDVQLVTAPLTIDTSGLAATRSVHGDAWTERYARRDESGVGWDAPTPFERLAGLIDSGGIDLVTSDVFDTLVTRPVATPSDLFLDLADRIDLPDHVTPPVFAQARRAAERTARQARADDRRIALAADPDVSERDAHLDPQVIAPEVTLDEIWANMPDDWGDAAPMLDAELSLEAEALQPIPETERIFARARQAGIPVVLVSDIYLTSEQLTDVLTRAGVDMSLVDEVVSSADHRLGKHHGLLAKVVHDRSVEPGRVAHIGDNEVADVQTTTGLGAHAIHVDVATLDRHVATVPAPLQAWSHGAATDLGISAAVRASLVGAGRYARDQSFQYGAAVMGPALAGFARWVANTTTSLGVEHVHCMLREGATIAETLRSTAPPGLLRPTPIPLHVSRWVTMRAAVLDGTAKELSVALARRGPLTADHVVRAFDCDPDRVQRAFGGAMADPDRIAESYDALVADEVLREQMVAAAADLRSRVMLYLRDRLVLEGGTLVLADVGWGGTIQEGLTHILHAEGESVDVVGLYLALSAPGEERLARGARMLSYLPNVTDDVQASTASRAVAHHADTVERIMTPALGTLVDIDDAGRPVCRPDDHDPIPPSLRSAQHGMRRVIDRLADRSTGLTDLTDPRWTDPALRAAFAETIAETVVSPSAALADALGSWSHDDVAGTDHRAISDDGLERAARYATVHDVDLLDPSGRNWLAGVASRVNPALSAQLSAEHRGVDIDQLAPESEAGVARLAAFEVGSDLSLLQIGRAVRVTPAGWSVVRLEGSVDSLRSLRFDAGEHAALVEIGEYTITLTIDGEEDGELRHVDLMADDDLIWVRAHPLDARRFAQQSGGHLLMTVAPELAARVRAIDVTVGFRCWRLDDHDALAAPPVRRRVEAQARRLAGAIRRRL